MKRLLYTKIFLLLPGLVVIFISCGKNIPEKVIATVGDSYVSVEEFNDTYLNLMLNTDKIDSPDLRQEHARFLVMRKLFAVAARQNGVQLDSVFLRAVRTAEEKALREMYFKKVIAYRVPEPEDSLLRVHFKRVNSQVYVRHIFSQVKNEIDSIYQIIRQEPDRFSEIALLLFNNRELAEAGGDLGWIEYNQMDPAFEDIAYSTPIDSISKPFRSAYGWHILQKLNERKNVFLTEENYLSEKLWLRNQVIRKQQQAIADRFANDMMLSKNIDIKEGIFYFVVGKIREVLKGNHTNSFTRQLSIEEVRKIDLKISDVRNEILVTFDGGQWTVKDFIERLDEIPPNLLHKNLVNGFYRLLRDFFLVQEAKVAGLSAHEIVRTRKRDAEDAQYAVHFLISIFHTEFNPGNIIKIKSDVLSVLTDSLSQIYPVEYHDATINSLYE